METTPAHLPDERAEGTLAALDIETDGLDPKVNRILAIAVVSDGEVSYRISDDETSMLQWLEDTLSGPLKGVTVVTWNGEEFDLPFLMERYSHHAVPTSLHLSPTTKIGKYGNPRFEGNWGETRHIDIAPMFKSVAEELGIPWSLKPVSRRVLGVNPIEVNREGQAMAKMDREKLKAYVASDAVVTRLLACRVLCPEDSTPTCLAAD